MSLRPQLGSTKALVSAALHPEPPSQIPAGTAVPGHMVLGGGAVRVGGRSGFLWGRGNATLQPRPWRYTSSRFRVTPSSWKFHKLREAVCPPCSDQETTAAPPRAHWVGKQRRDFPGFREHPESGRFELRPPGMQRAGQSQVLKLKAGPPRPHSSPPCRPPSGRPAPSEASALCVLTGNIMI